MPIKFSKGFARRKSSGNILDDAQQQSPVESSFRVLERRDRETHIFGEDGSRYKKSKPQILRGNSQPLQAIETSLTSSSLDRDVSPHDSVESHTHKSISTNGTTRFSNGSSKPSSIENSHHDLSKPAAEKRSTAGKPSSNIPPIPKPETPESPIEPPTPAKSPSGKKQKSTRRGKKEKEDSGDERLFSFGRRASDALLRKKSILDEHEPMPAPPSTGYSTTAEPPKLDFGGPILDGDSGFEGGLTSLISSLGKRTSTIPEEPKMDLDRQQQSFSSPRLPTADTLMSSSYTSNMERSGSRRSWDSQRSQEVFSATHRLRTKASNLSNRQDFHLHEAREDDEEEVDNELFDAVYASQTLAKRLGQSSQGGSVLNRPRMNNDLWIQTQNTIRSQYSSYGDPPKSTTWHNFDNNYRKHNATTLQGPAPPRAAGKVLSPAEFEKLKRQGKEAPSEENESEDSESSDGYEDEDDDERQKKMVRMRKKQEANLAVYRQQMMKVTGDTPSELPAKDAPKRSLNRMGNARQTVVSVPSFADFNINTAKQSADAPEKAGDESDEDVPLGVLHAHGFPSRSRPPTRSGAAMGADRVALRPPSQMSIRPVQAGAGRSISQPNMGSVPEFAKALPQDPYVGASLVNQSNRESMPYANVGAAVTAQANSGGPLPPGGLVSVIAGEERARAARRPSPRPGQGSRKPSAASHQPMYSQYMNQSSPNLMTNSGFDPQNQYPGMGGGPPESQATMQMNAQMTHMMQMQMQWMQQMQQMMQSQGLQVPNIMQPMPGMPGMPGMAPHAMYGNASGSVSGPNLTLQRPQSSAGVLHSRAPSAMSMLVPQPLFGHNVAQSMYGGSGGGRRMSSAQSVSGLPAGNSQQAYAASIAPSERSNVGQPSRYRPVNASVQQSKSARVSTIGPLPSERKNSRPHAFSSRVSLEKVPTLSTNYSDTRPHVSEDTHPEAAQSSVGLVRTKSPFEMSRSSSAPKLLSTTIKVTDKPKFGGVVVDRPVNDADDDDDEAGWEEMRKKREERKTRFISSTASRLFGSLRGNRSPRSPSPTSSTKTSGASTTGAGEGSKHSSHTSHLEEVAGSLFSNNNEGAHDIPEALYYDQTGFLHDHDEVQEEN